ncbi:histidine phosphatase family protein [Microbacterium sp.]|uniref:histidine phosphatase family protein n=1 Tax=Microbacterium sp. TaxID=51671 RepID=UPI003C791CC8
MTTFFLARHGETVWHADHRYAGVSDVALTRHGLGQAAALGAWAADAGLDTIIASPLSRAARSAAPAAETSGLEVRIDPRLIEIDFGVGEGLTPKELAERHTAEWDAFRRAPASSPLPEGESGRDGIRRALPVFDELTQEIPDGRVLVVAHATLLRLLVCEFAGIDPDGYRDLLPVLGNCTVTTLVYPWTPEGPVGPGRPKARLLGFDVPPLTAGS